MLGKTGHRCVWSCGWWVVCFYVKKGKSFFFKTDEGLNPTRIEEISGGLHLHLLIQLLPLAAAERRCERRWARRRQAQRGRRHRGGVSAAAAKNPRRAGRLRRGVQRRRQWLRVVVAAGLRLLLGLQTEAGEERRDRGVVGELLPLPLRPPRRESVALPLPGPTPSAAAASSAAAAGGAPQTKVSKKKPRRPRRRRSAASPAPPALDWSSRAPRAPPRAAPLPRRRCCSPAGSGDEGRCRCRQTGEASAASRRHCFRGSHGSCRFRGRGIGKREATTAAAAGVAEDSTAAAGGQQPPPRPPRRARAGGHRRCSSGRATAAAAKVPQPRLPRADAAT